MPFILIDVLPLAMHGSRGSALVCCDRSSPPKTRISPVLPGMRVYKIVYRKTRNVQYQIALATLRALIAYRGATAGGELRAASFKGLREADEG